MSDAVTDDIVNRLRCTYKKNEWPCEECTFCAARAEIERLRAECNEQRYVADEVTRLRAAVAAVDGLHEPLRDEEWLVIRCTQCDVEWPCHTRLVLHPREARRG